MTTPTFTYQPVKDGKEDKKLVAIGGCSIVILALILAPFFSLYHGWALWLLWNWFAVPIAPAISWHAAVGLMMLIGFLRTKPAKQENDPDIMASIKQLVVFNTSILASVGLGWAFHCLGFGAAT